MRRLAITGDRNRPGKRDWSGAFRPESMRFVIASGDTRSKTRAIDTKLPLAKQRDEIERAIVEVQPEELGVFCHGFPRRIELGHTVATVGALARVLRAVGCYRVGLYACSTAIGTGPGGDGGFADELRDALDHADARVVAHVVAGHATMSPHVRFFDGHAGAGGIDVVPRGSPLWRRWCQRLRDVDDPLRWDLLTMSVAEIRAALR